MKTTKTILGLDLGTTSIGWALVKEGKDAEIIKTGVRVVPLSTDEIQNFDKGKSITTNADRTLKRSARRNLQRFKLRRENLIEILKENSLFNDKKDLNENGNHTTFETIRLRAISASQKVELHELARILLMINKKRGYKSSRKAKGEDEGTAVDGMEIAKRLYNEQLTPGQLVHLRFQEGKTNIPDFYRSDLQNEFDKIWDLQKKFFPDIMTSDLYEQLVGKTKTITASIFRKLGFDGVELKGNLSEKRKERYSIRSKSVSEKITSEELSEILPEINGSINQSSGYLGAISDRSKELYFNKETVGQFQYKQIENNPHFSLKNQVFYRQDYLDEFNQIWETQQKYYPKVLTEKLKAEIRDVIIFYQRKLKSQKGLLSVCEFEGKLKEVIVDGKTKIKTIGPKVCPKSSPLFQEFKIWSQINNIEYIEESSNRKKGISLELDQMETLFDELNWVDKMTATEVIKLLGLKGYKLNFKDIEGNRTNSALISGLNDLFIKEGNDALDFKKMNSQALIKSVKDLMAIYGINNDILLFDSCLKNPDFEQQKSYALWHLLYSFEGDDSNTGIETLKKMLHSKFGFPIETNTAITNVKLQDDYSGLSSKAIRNILPYLKEGNQYDRACLLAGYNHSKSETKADLDNKVLKETLALLPKNSLRNPVVEKILNQMINVINAISQTYGKPDEIRVEMARELKKSAKERDEATRSIRKATDDHLKMKQELHSEFGLKHVSRNDLIRYKLYLELKDNGFKTLYSNQPIDRAKLFSSEYDIEHIIPQSKLFDDSFSNKTLELRAVNLKKGNATALDFVKTEYGEAGATQYTERVKALFENTLGKKTKFKKLMMEEQHIPDGFIERELRDSQYIAKKAKEILSSFVRDVHTTTGSITQKIREDWQLVEVMKELNWEKYDLLGLTETFENRHGQKIKRIKDWTKRNDHRHHAMDAIAVAFTKREHVKYFNNLNAKGDKDGEISKIQKEMTYFDKDQKRRFNPPMSLQEFRTQAKEHLENTLVSFKAKNKVTTNNKNVTLSEKGKNTTISKTPRGQLHEATIYGSSKSIVIKIEKITAKFDREKILTVTKEKYRTLLLNRLEENGNDPKKAFSGANSLIKKPIFLNDLQTHSLPEGVKCKTFEINFTIRKPISPDLKIDKVVDVGARKALERRLAEFGGDPKKAFVNLEENPIYLNAYKKDIVLKRVAISGVSNPIPLHNKRDRFGEIINDKSGKPIPSDFISTGNNHHVAIYKDENDKLREEIVSLYEAVERQNAGLKIINKNNEDGWEFLFTMKQNEYFVFPNEKTGFNPSEIDLLDEENYKKISPNLYRVQSISDGDYWFRHHLDTKSEKSQELNEISFKRRRSPSSIKEIIKVRINHIGKIVHVGEY
jgi:CRISPR-associated endonuclease Csn1